MKQQFLFFAALVLIGTSCSKEEVKVTTVIDQTPLVITNADLAQNFKVAGQSYSTINVNLSSTPVTAPASGENQNWDVSNLSSTSTPVATNFFAVNNNAFLTATYGRNFTGTFGFGSLSSNGTPAIKYQQVSSTGWFNMGDAYSGTAVLNIPSIGGTLTYAPQNVVYSKPAPIVNFPAAINNEVITSSIVYNVNFIANAPAVGVSNTPGQVRSTDSVINKIIASGNLTLKNIGKVQVLVNRQTVFSKTNYFLGGAPAPAALLTTLGLTDGSVSKYVIYDFYAAGLGIVGSISCSDNGSTVNGATFRVQ